MATTTMSNLISVFYSNFVVDSSVPVSNLSAFIFHIMFYFRFL